MADENDSPRSGNSLRPEEVVQTGRKNTVEEKRRMRNARKRRKRARKQQVKDLHAEVDKANKKFKESSDKVTMYKQMSRSFWERWQWELNQRKQDVIARRIGTAPANAKVNSLQEIDPGMLTDPPESDENVYVGRGAFGVVKHQLFRGMHVAVKELLPKTNIADVRHEAHVISHLCHPFLPYLFGVCTTHNPYRIVIQFHGIDNKSVTMSQFIAKKMTSDEDAWLVLCAQLLEAFQYLHNDAKIIHNDLTTNNIIVTNSGLSVSTENHQIIVIDFGKSTSVDQGRHCHLSTCEKAEYTRRYPQIAPEVIDGVSRQTTWSDMYSVGGVLYSIIDNHFFDGLPIGRKETLLYVARKCRCPQYYRRFSAQKALEHWKL